MNSVTLYSNGTAVIRQEYEFQDQQPLRISIPVRKSDLDDVISSLSVFGDAKVTSPPTYAPTNAQETALTLNPASVLKEMATKLAGAAVEIEAGSLYTGRLLGLHMHRREVNGTVVEEGRLLVLTEKGVQQVEETAVTAIRFTDPLVQSEIEKALQASLQQIKPDSSLVEMTIQPNSGASSAIVQYATPVAAWKIRYQLRLSANEAELEGQGVVDNDTDDDWREAEITVITGEPITFSTDLAEIRRPARRRVNIVADEAIGAVMAEPEMWEEMGDYESVTASADAAPPSTMMSASRAGRMEHAVQDEAEVRESGDFSLFRSPKPVTVPAKKSAIIPLFRTALDDARPVLFYNERHDAQRPFRAVRLKNSASHSLGKGVCEVFVDDDFQGKCILESTKQGDEVLLIHAKETGVRIFKHASDLESRQMAVRISDGTVYCEELYRQETTYRIQNSHPTAFTLEVEHFRMWNDSKLSISASAGTPEMTDIPSGKRIRVPLEASGRPTIDVVEETVERERFALETSWLRTSLIDMEAPLSDNEEIQKCLQLQKQIDKLQAEIGEQEQAAKTFEKEQQRLLKLIPNAHAEQANEWRTDLGTTENELREIRRTTVPNLKRQLRETQERLHQALASLRFTWNDEAKP